MIKPLIDQRPSKPSILHRPLVRTIRDIGPSWRVTLGCTETFKPAHPTSSAHDIAFSSMMIDAWNRKKRTPRDVLASKKNKQSSWMRRLSRNESKPKVNKVGDGQ
jgi:hypothetical protein